MTDFQFKSYGAKINVMNGVIEIVEIGELEFEQAVSRHKEALSSDRYKGYEVKGDAI